MSPSLLTTTKLSMRFMFRFDIIFYHLVAKSTDDGNLCTSHFPTFHAQKNYACNYIFVSYKTI